MLLTLLCLASPMWTCLMWELRLALVLNILTQRWHRLYTGPPPTGRVLEPGLTSPVRGGDTHSSSCRSIINPKPQMCNVYAYGWKVTPYLLDVHRSKVHAILRLGDVVVDDVLVLADEGGGGCGGEEAGGGGRSARGHAGDQLRR